MKLLPFHIKKIHKSFNKKSRITHFTATTQTLLKEKNCSQNLNNALKRQKMQLIKQLIYNELQETMLTQS